MKKTLRHIIQGTFLAGALTLAPALTPAEENLANTNQIINVSGRWYSEASGVTDSGWCWGWENMWLEQKGTNVSGTYRFEAYENQPISGSIESNRMILKYTSRTALKPRYLAGAISDDVFYSNILDENMKEFLGFLGTYNPFVKITNDLPLMDALNRWHTKEICEEIKKEREKRKQEENKSKEK
jgi:hypothetical protein